MGYQLMSSSNCSSACSASSRALTCSGVPEISEEFTAGNARRSAAGLAGKSDGLRLTADAVTRWPFSARRPTPRPAAPSARWPDRQRPPLDGDHRLTRGLSSRQRLNTARRSAVAVEMGGKDKVPVKAGGRFSTLQAGAARRTVCPARRIGVARECSPLPGSVTRQPVIQLPPADRRKVPFSILIQALLQGAGGERQAARRLADPGIDAARREGGQQVKVFRDLIGAIVLERDDCAGPKRRIRRVWLPAARR